MHRDEWQQVRDANHNIRKKKVKHQEQQDPSTSYPSTIPLVYPSDAFVKEYNNESDKFVTKE